MQPLDKTFMVNLKAMYSEEIRQWLRHSDRPVGAYEVMELSGKTYIKCQKAEILQAMASELQGSTLLMGTDLQSLNTSTRLIKSKNLL